MKVKFNLLIGRLMKEKNLMQVELDKNTYKPNHENRKIYDDMFEEFQNVYENNKKMYKRLNS